MSTPTQVLRDIFKGIANAIRRKDGTTEANDKIEPSDFESRIDAITTGVDTSDATATAADIASPKTAYVNGQKITGGVYELYTMSIDTDVELKAVDSYITLSGKNSGVEISPKILRPGATIKVLLEASEFGNVTAEEVVSGKTFTSIAGLKVTGTATLGVDTSDATASRDDIIYGKTAYVNGVKITGSLGTGGVMTNVYGNTDLQLTKVGANLFSRGTTSIFTGRQVIDSNTLIGSWVPLTLLGDVSASEVVSGKTFTSTDGVKVTGTMSNAGTITGTLGATSGANWSTSDPNRGSGTVSITGVNQTAGYTSGYSNGSITVTVPENRLLKGRTITPTTSSQSVGSAEDILYGAISVAGDANLIASNIKNGVSIFGVTGTLSTGTNTSDATASASDIASGKTAYGSSGKITGTLSVIASGSTLSFSSSWSSSNLTTSGTNIRITSNDNGVTSDKILRVGSKVIFDVPATLFGDVSASDIASGKTATSSSGVKISGSATSTASGATVNFTSTPAISGSYFTMPYTATSDRHFYSGAIINNRCLASNLGDATTDDVASGKTFTSKNGVKLTGTGGSGAVSGSITPTTSTYIDIPVSNASTKTELVLYAFSETVISSASNQPVILVRVDIKNSKVTFAYPNGIIELGDSTAIEFYTTSFTASTTASTSNLVNINSTRVRIYRRSASYPHQNIPYRYILI